jgi:hypothetical protein
MSMVGRNDKPIFPSQNFIELTSFVSILVNCYGFEESRLPSVIDTLSATENRESYEKLTRPII